ncbi:serine hydrolase domain-containing protein [Thermaurantiacus sp.]
MGGIEPGRLSAGFDRRAFLAAALAGALAPAPGFARRARRYAALEAMLEGWIAGGKVPGAIVAILRPGRFQPDYVAAGNTAFAGGRPVDRKTLWRIYSQTKPVTGVAVIQQVAAGRLTLDTPLGDILPAFRTMRVLVEPAKGLDSRPASGPILVRHLLTHTAGFSYHIMGNDPIEQEYRRRGLLPIGNLGLSPLDTPVPDLEGFLDALADLPLRFDPGTAFRYSLSLDVAGGMLQRLSATPFDRLLERQLFVPLGMADTGFTVTAANAPRLSALYSWQDEKGAKLESPMLVDKAESSAWLKPPPLPAGGAGLVSSAEDFARFAQMLLNEGVFEGRTLLPRAAARQAMTNMLPPGLFYEKVKGYGAGGQVILADSRTAPAGTLPGTFGWGGAAGTLFQVDPLRQFAVVLMLQGIALPLDQATGLQTALNTEVAAGRL